MYNMWKDLERNKGAGNEAQPTPPLATVCFAPMDADAGYVQGATRKLDRKRSARRTGSFVEPRLHLFVFLCIRLKTRRQRLCSAVDLRLLHRT